MLPIIWAFGAMLVLLLIIFFLPLGLTVKGKISIVLASFVLALGGLAAVLAIPMWETALILAALIFFTAYFMDKRIGTLMFKEIPTFGEEVNDEYEIPVPSSKIDKSNNTNSLELQELGIIEPSIIKIAGDSQLLVQPIIEQIIDNKNNKIQVEDISFLLERNSESEVEEQKEELVPENNYLSDIESLLAEEIDEEENSNDPIVPNELEPFADSSFDFLYESKEVAVEKGDSLEDMEKKKKNELAIVIEEEADHWVKISKS